MARAKHVAASWATYAERVLPNGAPPVQVQETRRAFYAGARGVLSRIMALAEEGEEPTERDMQMMEDIEHELEQFAADVAAGRK